MQTTNGVRIPHQSRPRSRRDEGVIVAKLVSPGPDGDFLPAVVKSFSGYGAFERYLEHRPGTVVQGAKHVYRGDVQEITYVYQEIVDLNHYLAASKDILEVISAH
jgi:hypothetical protein